MKGGAKSPAKPREELKPGSIIKIRDLGHFQVLGGLGDLVIVREVNRDWIALKLAIKRLVGRVVRAGARR